MPRDYSNSAGGLFSHLSSLPITVGFAAVVMGGLIILALLRHVFASVNVGTK
jgi:hypothetical protein